MARIRPISLEIFLPEVPLPEPIWAYSPDTQSSLGRLVFCMEAFGMGVSLGLGGSRAQLGWA